MREIRLSGSVRGAGREVRPYRDPPNSDAKQRGLLLVLPRMLEEPQKQQAAPVDGPYTACPYQNFLCRITIRCGFATFSGVPSLVNFTSTVYFLPASPEKLPRSL